MTPMRFHVLSLPHTRVSKEFCACAYSAKALNFCRMMTSLGHHVTLYAPEGSTADCDELVTTITTAEQTTFFGEYDWRKEMFKIEWNENQPYWKLTNARAAAAISERAQKGDIVCVVGGTCQKPCTDLLDHSLVAVCEPFIGYRGVYSRFQVYESYVHQGMNAARRNVDPDGDNYHDVVPVYFDPDDFPEGKGDGGYYLYLGRLIQRKGIAVAENTIKAMGNGAKLLIAGQGVKSWDAQTHTLVTEENQTFQGDHLEYVGFADVKRRAELLGGAIAAFTPTQYYEPGGNTSVEPQACGTPVLASNFGCFPQQVLNGISGFRPTTLEEWMWCANACKSLDRKRVRQFAHSRFSLDVVKYQFEEYFSRVRNLYLKQGWNTLNYERDRFHHYL